MMLFLLGYKLICLQAQLWHSQHWVLDLACQLEPLDAGAAQGIFVALASHAVLRLQLSKHTIQAATAARAGRSVLLNICPIWCLADDLAVEWTASV
jgi:hypothetical protein